MKIRNLCFLLASSVALLVAACAGGDTDGESGANAARNASRKGESCASTPDCADGLVCVGEVCLPEELGLDPTGKECAAVECVQPADCCDLVMLDPQQCASFQQACAMGDMLACSYYNQYCVCNAQQWSCDADACRFAGPCMVDSDCPGGVCNVNTCVECVNDLDCFAGSCVNSQCTADALSCQTNNDCPYFHTCQANLCVETGCTDTRECIEYTDDPLSFCQDAECRTPCASDAECITFGSALGACVGGFCEDAGCTTDEQCRIALGLGPGSFLKAVCRQEAP